MINLRVSNDETVEKLTEWQASAREAAAEIGAKSGGMGRRLQKGLAQLDRFVAANIQVATGRTKNGVFPVIDELGNVVEAGLHVNVRHAIYVGHKPKRRSQQFFRYAARIEAPKVVENVATDVVVTFEEAFS